jgi:Ternary complex associated domain 9
MAKINNVSIDPDDWRILDLVADDQSVDEADANYFTRYGRSSASLFLVRPHGGGVPLLVKTDRRDDIGQEARCTSSVARFMDDARAAHHMNMDVGGRDAMLFFVQGESRGSDKVDELDDHYTRALRGGEFAEEELETLLGLLREVYENEALLGMAHRCTARRTPRTYGEYFDRYERASSPNRLEELFASYDGPVTVYGEDFNRPLTRMDELRQEPALLYPVDAIHGDLHLSNVVVSTDGPHLVDFAWSSPSDHLLKDFVMMESSIRFMQFPRQVHPKLLERIDRTLNDQFDAEGLADAIRASPDDHFAWAAYAMVRCVAEIRQRVRHLARELRFDDGDTEREYARCLYLVLAGQQRFNSFPLLRVLWNLHSLEAVVYD